MESFIGWLVSLISGSGGGGSSYGLIGAKYGGGVAPPTGTVLDQIFANGNSDFNPIFTALDNIGSISQHEEGKAIKELGPNQLGPQMAASDSLMNLGAEAIGQHQENVVENTNGVKGVNAGSEYHSGIFWGQVSGGRHSEVRLPHLAAITRLITA